MNPANLQKMRELRAMASADTKARIKAVDQAEAAAARADRAEKAERAVLLDRDRWRREAGVWKGRAERLEAFLTASGLAMAGDDA